jgi:hypothetical protein
MVFGIFVNGRRPANKKVVREAVAAGGRVSIENTSPMFPQADGDVSGLADGKYCFVCPDPYNNRKYFGNLTVKAGKVTKVE